MPVGFDRPLYVLPFDHRSSFELELFDWKGELTPEQTAQVAETKAAIYDGFKAAVAEGVPKERAGILVDEQFGAAVLRDASQAGYITACPAEKSGREVFAFEYGEDFARHIEAMNPTFSKVLVRYNPEADAATNVRQTALLRQLADYLHGTKRLMMFELLVPPEPAQLAKLGGDRGAYEREVRPGLMVQAMRALQDVGVEPDVWKVEGLDRREDCVKVVAAARRGGRDAVSCIILGRGEDEPRVRHWLQIAAGVPGFIGFAVGRTTFMQALTAWRARQIPRDAAVAEIAKNYRRWVGIFEGARQS
jgi:myo-inositol catabolism protein IolC